MGKTIEITVPDIGDFTDVPVIEVLVAAGDRVEAEDSLITLESDKATMEVPAPQAGLIREVRLKVGDTVSKGDVVAVLEAETGAERKPEPEPVPAPERASAAEQLPLPVPALPRTAPATTGRTQPATQPSTQTEESPAKRCRAVSPPLTRPPYPTRARRCGSSRVNWVWT